MNVNLLLSIEDKSSPKDGLLNRDKRRWIVADVDGDNKLSREEFESFLHPEEFPRMREVLVDVTLKALDLDHDGVVSLEEYVTDLWPHGKSQQQAEPEWLKAERSTFSRHRDLNGDKHMDRDEISLWLLPRQYKADDEAQRIVKEIGKDGKISKSQMLRKFKHFVGDQALDFGQTLKTHHDEF